MKHRSLNSTNDKPENELLTLQLNVLVKRDVDPEKVVEVLNQYLSNGNSFSSSLQNDCGIIDVGAFELAIGPDVV